jgi:hypothetical protein
MAHFILNLKNTLGKKVLEVTEVFIACNFKKIAGNVAIFARVSKEVYTLALLIKLTHRCQLLPREGSLLGLVHHV